ncbi:MAG: hypothetical protein CMH53_07360 [Myxococcales bacterium]|nr:hypothetical protein [Myxococcales bacterium]
MPRFLIAALYHFTALPDFRQLRDAMYAQAAENQLKGTLLLADEGINGTIAGPEPGVRRFLAYVRSDPRFTELKHKESWSDEEPFIRLKVRLKKEIVTIGLPEVDPTEQVGTYVEPKDWNALISQPDVFLIDTRNTYETEMGTFKGAVDPNTESFGEFPTWVEKHPELTADTPVAMFCTGGIRCEKASSYMLEQGFKEVYHLQGGILQYLHDVPEDQSLWQGECYVFDRRVSVDHDLKPGRFEMCRACGAALEPHQRSGEHYRIGVSCLYCFDQTSEAQKAGFAERQKQVELAKARQHSHFDPHKPAKGRESGQ